MRPLVDEGSRGSSYVKRTLTQLFLQNKANNLANITILHSSHSPVCRVLIDITILHIRISALYYIIIQHGSAV